MKTIDLLKEINQAIDSETKIIELLYSTRNNNSYGDADELKKLRTLRREILEKLEKGYDDK